jgi:uncharacterized protein (DUF2267 family)
MRAVKQGAFVRFGARRSLSRVSNGFGDQLNVDVEQCEQSRTLRLSGKH